MTPRSARSPTSVRAWSTSAGHLFFEQDGGLYTQTFDISRFETSGAPIRLSDRIGYGSGFGSFIDRAFSVSSAGRLVFARGYMATTDAVDLVRSIGPADRARRIRSRNRSAPCCRPIECGRSSSAMIPKRI